MTVNVKKAALNIIKKLPKNVSIDELIDRLEIIREIQEAEEQIKQGKVVPHEQVKKMIETWLK